MILLRKLFAKKDSKDKKKENKDKALATGGIVGGSLILSKNQARKINK